MRTMQAQHSVGRQALSARREDEQSICVIGPALTPVKLLALSLLF